MNTSSQDPSRSRPHDVVVWGASGFTGRLVAEYLVRTYAGTGLQLALGGRNERKLNEVREGLTAIDARAGELPIVTGDSLDPQSLDAVTSNARVVCTTVGPYSRYGAELVAACVRNGTDYCDLTGEVPFIRRMIDRHHADAKHAGVRIVHCCGYDSIPSDLGTLMMQRAFKERFGAPASEVRLFAGEARGGVSGGTAASMLELLDEAERDANVGRLLADPYALNPDGERPGPDGPDPVRPRYDPELGMWTGPFVMAAINTRVVRRSHALLGFPWGRDFRYQEASSFGQGPAGAVKATAAAGGLAGLVLAGRFRAARALLGKLLPSPGEGPSETQREQGYFRTRLIAKGGEGGPSLRGFVAGDRDPGYGATAIMLGESAACLALERGELDSGGGVLTPASAMGEQLLARLRAAGIRFEVGEVAGT